MKKNLSLLFVSFLLFFFSCNENTNQDDSNADYSSLMADFNSMMKGSSSDVSKALLKYAGTKEVQDDDMKLYDFKNPEITSKNGNCFSAEYTTGVITKLYDICWSKGKISKIIDKGMK